MTLQSSFFGSVSCVSFTTSKFANPLSTRMCAIGYTEDVYFVSLCWRCIAFLDCVV